TSSEDAVDILLVVDSSGSITTWEFSKIRELLEGLVGSLNVGPQRVLVGLILVSDSPILEFSFTQHNSSSELLKALGDLEQRWGDTNSGKALDFAREQVLTPEQGSRLHTQKVMVWVTDGMSSDDVLGPAKLLKQLGVKIFVVSTGRISYGLQEVASPPTEEFLFFVDADSLPLFSGQLCTAIIDAVSPKKMAVSEVTAESFRVSWPQIASSVHDRYILDYAPARAVGKGKRFSLTLPWDAGTAVLKNLLPLTTYDVTLLTANSNQALWVNVTTLEGETGPTNVSVPEVWANSLRLDWAPSPKYVSHYQVLYGPVAGGLVRSLEVNGSEEGLVLRDLKPMTAYLITVTAHYQSGRKKSFSVMETTRKGE
uniref:von Willebrand factor A domain-containing protein 1 n=1 Tax=Latimeria chalumnae TaxID=7897 RepID=H3A4K7_LATCH